MTGPSTLADVLAGGRQALADSSPSPTADAEVLLAHVLARPRVYLRTWPEQGLLSSQATRFSELITRRRTGEPIAYITGRREFWSLSLRVDHHTLIPRPETELLVEHALARMPPSTPLRVLELGTGCGAIALALAHERPRCRIVATDVSPEAIAVAEENRRAHAIENIEFRCGDWFAPLAGATFDLIVSNPPYIAAGDPHLHAGDPAAEPPVALCGGADGLAMIRRLIERAGDFLVVGGLLALECGHDQQSALDALLEAAGFTRSVWRQDYAGHDRAVVCEWPGGSP